MAYITSNNKSDIEAFGVHQNTTKQPLMADSSSSSSQSSQLNWKWIAIFAAIVILLLVIIVPIAVLVPKNNSDSSNDDDFTPIPPPTPSTYPQLIPIFPENFTATGIRQDINNNVVITGGQSTNPVGDVPGAFIYYGPLENFPLEKSAFSLHYFLPNFPNETIRIAAFYGPNSYLYDPSIGEGNVIAVGGYNYVENEFQVAIKYQGPLDGSGVYTKLVIPPMVYNVTLGNGTVVKVVDETAHALAHSVMGDLIVGNVLFQSNMAKSYGFIYSQTKGFVRTITFDNAFSTTLYGIWQNGNNPSSTSYTIIGGLTTMADLNGSSAFIMNYDAVTNEYSNFKMYDYKGSVEIPTHFEGVSAYANGYTMAATAIINATLGIASLVYVPVMEDGSFGDASWYDLNAPQSYYISGNTVLEKYMIGVNQTAPVEKGDDFYPDTSFFVNCSQAFPFL